MRLSYLLPPFAALILSGCPSSDGPTDSGMPPDAGFIDLSDAGRPDAAPDAGAPDGGGGDGGVADTGPSDAGFIDSGMGDGGLPDAGLADTGPGDGGLLDSGVDGGVVVQNGELAIVEILIRAQTGLEWLEIRNTTGAAIDLRDYTITVDASGLGAQTFRAVTDPSGGAGTSIPLAAQGVAFGVPNPASAASIPAGASFVFGDPGANGANAFSDNGDGISIASVSGVADRFSYVQLASAPGADVSLTELPVATGLATQLDVDVSDLASAATDNDDVSRWCVPIFDGSTPGLANRDCDRLVISEVLYDFDSLTTGADGANVFVEIAGPAGALLSGVLVTSVRGTDGQIRGSVTLSKDRMPLNGLYVVADGANGLSNVQNADQVMAFDPLNADASIQLVRSTNPPVLLDAFAHGALTVQTDATRGLALQEGTAAVDIDTRVFPANYARTNDEADSNNNLVDFVLDGSPSPGEPNGSSELELLSLIPSRAMSTATVTLTIVGRDLTDFMTLTVGTETIEVHATGSSCVFETTERFRCPLMSPILPTASLVDATLEARPEVGGSSSLVNGFRWLQASNEDDVPAECDFCNLQFPATVMTTVGVSSGSIYGRIYETGVTEAAGDSGQIVAELGYGLVGSDPRFSNAWTWLATAYSTQSGNDDEYVGSLTIGSAGTWAYAFRYSLDGGSTWSFADLDGAGSNAALTFNPASLGTITVTP